MKITSEINLTDFEFCSGAKNHSFTYDELKKLEYIIEDLYCEGVEEGEINDLFWFEEQFLCEYIGVDYEEDYLNR